MPVRAVLCGATGILVAVLVIYPLIMLIAGSLSPAATANGPAPSPLHGYLALFREWTLLRNSFVVAGGATALALLLGVTLAWILARAQIPLRGLFEQLVTIPFYLSPLLGALGWVVLAAPGRAGLLNTAAIKLFGMSSAPLNIYSPAGIIWVLGIFFTPFVFLIVAAALRSIDPSLEESSRVIGAGRLRTALRVALPVVRPAILNAAVLVFILSLGNFAVPAVLGMPKGYLVLTTRIYQYVSGFETDYAAAAAMGLTLLLFGLLGVYLQSRLLGGRSYVTVTGRAFRGRLVKVGGWTPLLMAVPIVYVLLTVVLPIGVMAWVSFLQWTTFDPRLARFTLANYRFILGEYPITWIAIRNGLVVAMAGATIVMMLGLIVAWTVQRSRAAGVRVLEYMLIVPVAVPAMVFGLGLLWAWINLPVVPIYGTIWLLILCDVTILLPYGVRTLSATVVQLDRSLEECAQVIGAPWIRVMRTVTLPLLAGGVRAGWTLVFVAGLNELGAMALLVTSKTVVLAVAVYDLFSQNTYPNVAVLALLQAAIIVAVLAAARLVGRRWEIAL